MSACLSPQTLTLRSVSDIAAGLRAALAAGGGLTLDLAGVEDCDALGFQLVEAARAEAARQGAALTVTAPRAEGVRAVLTRLGASPSSHPHWFTGAAA